MQDLAGKNAVVVGGGQGIGRGIALALAREGMDVAILDIEEAAAAAVAEEVRSIGVRSVGLRADVTNTDYLNSYTVFLQSFCKKHLFTRQTI